MALGQSPWAQAHTLPQSLLPGSSSPHQLPKAAQAWSQMWLSPLTLFSVSLTFYSTNLTWEEPDLGEHQKGTFTYQQTKGLGKSRGGNDRGALPPR